jgi:hypothetical protein
MMIKFVAHLFTFLIVVVFAFQIALAVGVPWGHLTWGGRFPGQLPVPMRGAALLSAVLLVAFAVVVETRAGVLLSNWRRFSRLLVWVVVAYCALGVVANAITPSYWERIIWLPVVVVLLVCSSIVATHRESV